MKDSYDVVIVGAGINGLACGSYLAKAGLDVAVIEKRNECGPFALTEDIFGAGVPVDTHAGVCFLPMSPVWGDLDLSSFGFEIIFPEVGGATVWPDKNLVYYSFNREKNAEAIGKYSQKDAKTYLRIAEQIAPRVPEIVERAVFTAPSPEGEDYLFSLGSIVGFSPRDLRTMNGMELLDLLYDNEYVRTSLLGMANIGVYGDPAQKGEGAVMTLLGWGIGTGVPKGGMHNLVHALVRCFRHHGGTLMLNAPVAKVTWAAGRPDGVVLEEDSAFGPREIKARKAVVMHTSPPIALKILGDKEVAQRDSELERKMNYWDMTGHCAFTSYFLLSEPPHWSSASWNPDIMKCPYPVRAWDSWDHAARSLQYTRNEELSAVAADVAEMYNLAAVDPSRRSRDGKCAMVFEIEYPVNLRRYGGIKAWDNREITDELHESHRAQIEALAPGFRQLVLADSYSTPLDNWRRNPSAIYGHELGGDVSGAQWYMGRMPNRSHIPGLYFSNGVWPGSLTHLATGYITATAVAEDLGVRKQEWWCHHPFDQIASHLGG
jgi:beta-carotene ketolase (CrtO type)